MKCLYLDITSLYIQHKYGHKLELNHQQYFRNIKNTRSNREEILKQLFKELTDEILYHQWVSGNRTITFDVGIEVRIPFGCVRIRVIFLTTLSTLDTPMPQSQMNCVTSIISLRWKALVHKSNFTSPCFKYFCQSVSMLFYHFSI